MSEFIWKLRFAVNMKFRSTCSLSFAWECASDWARNYGTEMRPSVAVAEEFSYWSE